MRISDWSSDVCSSDLDDFDYLRQSDSIFLDNSIQYSDFNSPKERSWMVRYDLDMSSYGVPGLSFMTRYGRGTDADYSNANATYMRRDADGNPLTDQKRWEREIGRASGRAIGGQNS